MYLGDGWRGRVEEAAELGFADLSVGFNRLAEPGRSHDEHLDAIVAVKAEVEAIVGRIAHASLHGQTEGGPP